MRLLLEAYANSKGYASRRDFALVTLWYRAGLKIGECMALQRRHYNPGDHHLTIPASKSVPERRISLDRESREALNEWMEARRELGVKPTAPLFCLISKPYVGGRLDPASVRVSLAGRALAAGIDRRVHPQGIRDSGIRHREDSRGRVQTQVGPYIDTEGFQARYPDAYDRWEAALDLQRQHPDTNARRIGLDCREAIQLFVGAAAEQHGVQLKGNDVVDELRTLLRAFLPKGQDLSRHLQALVEYWTAMSRLAHRQVHENDRDDGKLRPVDADRLIFHTLVVMLEIDRTLPESRESPALARKPKTKTAA